MSSGKDDRHHWWRFSAQYAFLWNGRKSHFSRHRCQRFSICTSGSSVTHHGCWLFPLPHFLHLSDEKKKQKNKKQKNSHFGTCLESVDSECANIGGNSVPFKTSVKYLWVHLDGTLSVQKHISSICCASFLELWRIASVWPYLSQSAAARLVAAMVISRLDYCNSVLIGLPADQIARL